MENTNQAYQNIQAMLDTITRTTSILHKDNVEKLTESNVNTANEVISESLSILKQSVISVKNFSNL